MRKIVFIFLAVIVAVFLLCLASEEQTTRSLKESEEFSSESWKEYSSLVGIWPQLKREGIESIRFCDAISLEYGYELPQDLRENVNEFGYRGRAADVVRWWPTTNKVPEEKLPECIEILDRLKDKNRYWTFGKMLVVTGKGKYIFPRDAWMSDEFGKFIVKYCNPNYDRWYFLPPKEQTLAILIFSDRKCEYLGAHDSMIDWPPIVLFGDKKKAEEVLGRKFEPRMVFESREWLEKIMAAYETAMKDAKEKEYRIEDSSVLQGWIVVVTQDEFYWRGIGIGENGVVGEYITDSKQLKEYFDEIGLTKELLVGEPNTAELIEDTGK